MKVLICHRCAIEKLGYFNGENVGKNKQCSICGSPQFKMMKINESEIKEG